METLILTFLSILLSFTAMSQNTSSKDSVYLFSYFKGNGEDGLHLAYSEDGLQWKSLNNDRSFLTPAVGKDKLMRDPCIIQGQDGAFHMVWTVSWGEKGIGLAHSKDLTNWSEQQYIPVMEHEDSAMNSWAPEIYYDEPQKLYIIYWATTIPGRFPESQKKGDEKYNHRMYYTTTQDFKAYSPTKLLYDQGFNVIDATIQQKDGTYYMFLKDETRYPPEKNIRIATSDKLTGPYSKPSKPITGDYWAEGPTVAKVRNRWLVYFDKYTDHQMGAVASENLQDWQDISDQVEFPEGTRHGTVFKVSRQVFDHLLKKNN